jgi:hypothetical protein
MIEEFYTFTFKDLHHSSDSHDLIGLTGARAAGDDESRGRKALYVLEQRTKSVWLSNSGFVFFACPRVVGMNGDDFAFERLLQFEMVQRFGNGAFDLFVMGNGNLCNRTLLFVKS